MRARHGHPNSQSGRVFLCCKRASQSAALAALAISLAGCQGIVGSSQYTQVRYIDASPDAPALDFYQGSTPSLYNVGFGTVSSYIPVNPGGATYSVNIAGTQQQLANARGTFLLGNQYTVLVGNNAANLQMTVLQDRSTPAPSGQVALRFLNEAARVGAVDIYLLPPNGSLSTTVPTLLKVPFAGSQAYMNVPAGTYSIVILAAGTATSSTTSTTTSTSNGTTTTTTTTVNNIPTLSSGNQVNYPSSAARTIILMDEPAGGPAAVQIVTTDDYDAPGT